MVHCTIMLHRNGFLMQVMLMSNRHFRSQQDLGCIYCRLRPSVDATDLRGSFAGDEIGHRPEDAPYK